MGSTTVLRRSMPMAAAESTDPLADGAERKLSQDIWRSLRVAVGLRAGSEVLFTVHASFGEPAIVGNAAASRGGPRQDS
jgi:hypothetical protein